jgi:hypothetical protein
MELVSNRGEARPSVYKNLYTDELAALGQARLGGYDLRPTGGGLGSDVHVGMR